MAGPKSAGLALVFALFPCLFCVRADLCYGFWVASPNAVVGAAAAVQEASVFCAICQTIICVTRGLSASPVGSSWGCNLGREQDVTIKQARLVCDTISLVRTRACALCNCRAVLGRGMRRSVSVRIRSVRMLCKNACCKTPVANTVGWALSSAQPRELESSDEETF